MGHLLDTLASGRFIDPVFLSGDSRGTGAHGGFRGLTLSCRGAVVPLQFAASFLESLESQAGAEMQGLPASGLGDRLRASRWLCVYLGMEAAPCRGRRGPVEGHACPHG